MYDFPVALQLYSVRDDMAADFEGTLKKVKAMGYDGVEFAGLFGHSAAEVKKMCADIGLNPISAHVPYYDMVADTKLVDDYAEIGCKYIVVPHIAAEYLAGGEKAEEFVANLKMLGQKANECGMKLCYHNHDFEFEKVNGEYKLDILYKEVPAELLSTQLDTCWVNVGGENPVDYIHKYAGRIEIIHLKDFAGSKSDNMYALIGVDDDKKKDSSGSFEFRPVGSGLQDFPAILAASKEVGAKWVVVEQDNPSMGKTPLECAKSSIEYLKSIY